MAGAGSELAWQEIVRRYGEPQRHYHADGHIAICLGELDKLGDGPRQRDRVEMALWFHDLVYDAGSSENERRSAEKFAELAKGELEPAAVDAVYRYVLATAHDGEPGGLDAQYVVDIDLAGLAGSWEHFLADTAALRRERSDLSDDEFRSQNDRFLQGLLAREHIYFTAEFVEHREARARANITRYLGVSN